MKRVKGEGLKDAKIIIIGEAPGAEEEKEGRPFVGSSGKLLNDCLLKAGINRDDCYITNVIKVRPPHNKLDRLGELGFVIEDFLAELFHEIREVNPNIIIALGNTPLRALTKQESISKWRGSILSTEYGKVIPAFHPAACIRQWSWVYILTHDLRRAKKESEFPEIRRKERTYIINPNFEDIIKYLDLMKDSPFITVDFETYMYSGLIRCLGIGNSTTEAMSIPFLKEMKPIWSIEEEKAIWLKLAEVLINPKTTVIAQNAQFELLQFYPYLKDKLTIGFDTMRAHALVYPEFPHGLDFLTSIYTDMEYYKDEGKISTEKGRDFNTLQTYNCKDIVATHESALKLMDELRELDLTEFYFSYDNPLMHLLLKMQMKGVRIDVKKLEEHKVRIDKEITDLQSKLEEELGYSLNVKSNKQMTKFLYKDLKFPVKYKKGSKGPTANEETLTFFSKKYPKVKSLRLVMNIRRLRTLRETFLEMKLSRDKRIRTSYGITETGRLSSSKNIFGEGANLQNIPKRRGEWIRELFIPDKGLTLVTGDLSQAEARVVAWLSQDPNYTAIFKRGGDVHKEYAALLFNVPIEKVTKKERSIAKNLRHARNYGMGPILLAKELGITKTEAIYLINEDRKIFPNIEGVFWAEVERQLRFNRTLTTPFGRKRTFLARWGDALLREAYAFIPQSTVADYIDSGILRLSQILPKEVNILMQVHDEVVLQCKKEEVSKVIGLIRESIEVPIIIKGEELTIPLEIKTGPSWGQLEVVKCS